MNAFRPQAEGEEAIKQDSKVIAYDQWSQGMGTGFEGLGLLKGLLLQKIFGWKDSTDALAGAGALGHGVGHGLGAGYGFGDGETGWMGGAGDFGHLGYQSNFNQRSKNYEPKYIGGQDEGQSMAHNFYPGDQANSYEEDDYAF